MLESLAGTAVKAVAGAAASSLFGGSKKQAKERPESPDFSKFNMGMMAPRKKDDSEPAPVAGFNSDVFDYMKLIQGITKPNG
jgi:hypothetical protein